MLSTNGAALKLAPHDDGSGNQQWYIPNFKRNATSTGPFALKSLQMWEDSISQTDPTQGDEHYWRAEFMDGESEVRRVEIVTVGDWIPRMVGAKVYVDDNLCATLTDTNNQNYMGVFSMYCESPLAGTTIKIVHTSQIGLADVQAYS